MFTIILEQLKIKINIIAYCELILVNMTLHELYGELFFFCQKKKNKFLFYKFFFFFCKKKKKNLTSSVKLTIQNIVIFTRKLITFSQYKLQYNRSKFSNFLLIINNFTCKYY